MRTVLVITTALLTLTALAPGVAADDPLPTVGPLCSAVLGVCVDPSDPAVVDWERLQQTIQDLIGPCTCPPRD